MNQQEKSRAAVHEHQIARFHNPDAARWLRSHIAQARPDLVHVHNFMRRLSPAPLRVARAAGVPSKDVPSKDAPSKAVSPTDLHFGARPARKV